MSDSRRGIIVGTLKYIFMTTCDSLRDNIGGTLRINSYGILLFKLYGISLRPTGYSYSLKMKTNSENEIRLYQRANK